MDIFYLLYYCSALLATLIIAGCIFLVAITSPYPIIKRSESESIFSDLTTGTSISASKLEDPPSVTLSIIVPAYNEEERLPPMLDECLEFLKEKKGTDFSYEIIVVSDGSKDKTVDVAKRYSKKEGFETFRFLDLQPNRGKGGAVRLGVQSSRGALVLFADADGATKFSDYSKLQSSLESLIKCKVEDISAIFKEIGIAIGSRAHLEQEAIASRSFFRTILMHGFHFLVWLFAVRGIKDTQCGFKLFTRQAAFICFESLHVERWAFDVELLYIAQKLNIPIKEVAVNWTEIEGSKVTPVWSWVQMGFDLGIIWLRYAIGAWKIKAEKIK